MKKNSAGRLTFDVLPEVKKAKLLVIGETVFLEEIKAGKYFISQGAEALRITLSNHGINLDDCAYTVAIPFLMNKVKTVTPEMWEEHSNRLWKEIQECGAEIVLPLGTLATQMVLGDKQSTITKMLGNIIDRDFVKIIPNYHPASLVHNPGNYKVFAKIIEGIAKMYKGRPMDPGVTQYKTVSTQAELQEMIQYLRSKPYVAIDIETNSLCTWDAKIWTVGFCAEKNLTYVLPRETIIGYPALFQKALNATRTILHNGKYDQSVLYWTGVDFNVDEDTLLLHYCINETSGTHGLGQLATVYLGADEYKSEMNSEFSHIKDEDSYKKYKVQLMKRVAIDCDYTFQLYEILADEVSSNSDWTKLYRETLMPASNFLTRVQANGAKVDIPYLKSRIPVYEKKIEDILKLVQGAVNPYWDTEAYKEKTGAKSASEEFKPTSTKQMSYMVWDVFKLRPTIRCKKGGTGEEILLNMVQQYVEGDITQMPYIKQLEIAPSELHWLIHTLELRKVKKEFKAFCMTYLESADSNSLVHPTFNLFATATGRLSCTDPNLQQVPSSKPDIRAAFKSRYKNGIMMEVDYSGAELRVLAWISGDEKLQKSILEGDMHSEVAASIFGPDFTKAQRGIAKTVNFGIVYGRGADDLHASFPQYTKEECQGWIDGWIKTYPQAWAYLVGCAEAVEKGEPLVTVYGRWKRVGLVTRSNLKSLQNEAKNFRIQSVSSDNTLHAAMSAENLLASRNAIMVNLIHDSILIDCPGDPETVHYVATTMANTMMGWPKKHYGCEMPFHSDVDLGRNWGEALGYDINTRTIKTKEGKINYEDWFQTWAK